MYCFQFSTTPDLANGSRHDVVFVFFSALHQRFLRSLQIVATYAGKQVLGRSPANEYIRSAMAGRVFAFRLGPGEELKSGVVQKLHDQLGGDGCAWVATCVGSLTHCTLRLANAEAGKPNEVVELDGRFEILSLVGTISVNSGSHLHISLGDKDGNCIGGHLMGDAVIFTTAEVVCGYSPAIKFNRPHDPRTGYPELAVSHDDTDNSRWLRDIAIASVFFSLGCLIAATKS